jgi:hypothetical protein
MLLQGSSLLLAIQPNERPAGEYLRVADLDLLCNSKCRF